MTVGSNAVPWVARAPTPMLSLSFWRWPWWRKGQGWGGLYPPPPLSNEHCVQRTLPVRTVFFVYLINSVHN